MKISTLIALLVIGAGFLAAHDALAQTITSNDLGISYGAATGLGTVDIRLTVARIIRAALGFLGVVAVVMILYGGFIYMTAGGNEEKVSEAKKILINGAIGLVIILSAFSIASFIMSKLVGATTGRETDGGGGEDGGGSGGFLSNVFYVSSLPGAGSICIRNISLLIVFNKEIDLATLGGNVVVTDFSASDAEVAGSWKYGNSKNMAVFTPGGSCAPSVGNDCFRPATAYNLVFKNAAGVRTLDKNPELALNCRYKAGCGPVSFKSGLGVDRLPPSVTITYPMNSTVLQPGTTVPASLHYSDDNGVQNLTLSYAKGSGSSALIDSVSFGGCKQSDDVVIPWPTGGVAPGVYTLSALATDWAGLNGSDTQSAILRPGQCFNEVQDVNEAGIDCGGESGCGCCAGAACGADQCASGTSVNGICRDVMRIDGFSPASGAPGTYVTISGRWFGETPGKVYFAVADRPRTDNPGDWKEAKVVNCGNVIDNWSDRQILVEVPVATAASSPIKVEAAPVVQDGVNTTPIDVTSARNLLDFKVTTLVRPGICTLVPNHGQAGDLVNILGKNFGALKGATDNVSFGDLKAVIAQNQNGTLAWAAERITASAPALAAGSVGVTVTKDGVPSNGVRFLVAGGATATEPFISSVTPGQGAAGDYITITGGNFGDTVGSVWFKATSASAAIIGSFNFPAVCQDNLWSDKKIIVKFPAGAGAAGTAYLVQINTSDNRVSAIDGNQTFTLKSGEPSPGICSITPLSGPIPFPPGQTIRLSGEYFLISPPGGTTGPLPTDVYFWSGTGNPAAITGRPAADRSASFSITTTTVTARPPDTTISGPVSVYRGIDQKISNPVNFSAADCRVGANQCAAGSRCCFSGDQAGFCKPNAELCVGETRSSGYVWRFSTKDLPPVPRIVERCDAATESGAALPTPTPSVQWDANNQGDHHAVCSSALAVVEFSAAIDQASVNAQSVAVSRCTSVDGRNNCVNPVPQTLSPESYRLALARGERGGDHSYLKLQNTKPWDSGIWYQVVLSNKIKSDASVTGAAVALSADKPCGGDSAYCFVFQGGGQPCVLNRVVVTPYSYLTEYLEAPMRRRTVQGIGVPVDYAGNGLSNQRCIMMDVSGYAWGWTSGNAAYADIYSTSTGRVVNVSAKANTVGVGIALDSVPIQAAAATNTPGGTIVKRGQSPLTIDLTNPAVVDYWPKCLEACTDADVAVQFNVSLSTKNIDGNAIERGAVKLNKCNDENCLSVTQVGVSSDVVLGPQSPFNILHIANSASGSTELEPNQLYQVVVSAVSSDPAAVNQIWSRARSDAPASFSKPYNQEFIWRFRTKKDKCAVSRVAVAPAEFIARFVTDRKVFTALPFSSPDSCSAAGQKLNPWKVNWTWSSTAPAVADLATFSTKGRNSFCTASCVKKGSAISSAAGGVWPVCGNGRLEAGEDCDPPFKATGCGLDCRFLGNASTSTVQTADSGLCGDGFVTPSRGEACDPNDPKTKIGCSANCLHLGSFSAAAAGSATSASICGNGAIGSGEDCDIGIAADLSSPTSAFGCSAKCLHSGTHLTSRWCVDNQETLGGFGSIATTTCASAYSQCGDGVYNPEEDPGCDLGGGRRAAWCNDYCLVNNKNHPPSVGCVPDTEGCGAEGQYLGSSLSYSLPSVCGDGYVGIGEEQRCEAGLTITRDGLTDPWTLAIGVGKGVAEGDPPAQRASITAATTPLPGKTVSGSGKFVIACGYKTDADCAAARGGDYGVAPDSCCYARPRLIKPTVPVDKASDPVNGAAVCVNTAIRATFDQPIDPATVQNNFLIARGIVAGGSCSSPANDVTALIASVQENGHRSWLRKALDLALYIARRIFGEQVAASSFAPLIKWCTGQDLGTATVSAVPDSVSYINFALLKPLAPETNYAVILKPGIKNTKGVSIGLDQGGKNISWRFDTRSGPPCLIDSVTVDPTQWYFARANATTTLAARAYSGSGGSGALLQSLPGFYSWDYIWAPRNNSSVGVPASREDKVIIASKNSNGEATVRASARLIDNIFTSATGTVGSGTARVVVFLCENPWPPKDLFIEQAVPAGSNTIGAYTSAGFVIDIEFSGKYAYVLRNPIRGNGSFEIVNFSDPSHPAPISLVPLSGSAHEVVASGDYAYVTYFDKAVFPDGDILKVFNVSDPTRPTEVSTYRLVGGLVSSGSVSVSGGYFFALLRGSSKYILLVVDIRNPAEPASVMSYPLSEPGIFSGALSGNYFYLLSNISSDGPGILAIFDVHDPLRPTRVTSYNFSDPVEYVPIVSGNYLYIGGHSRDRLKFNVKIVDISNPRQPVSVSSVPVAGSVIGMSVAGDLLYTIGRNTVSQNTLHVFDVHDPVHPTPVDSKVLSEWPSGQGIFAYKDYLFLATKDPSNIGSRLEIITQRTAGTVKAGPFAIFPYEDASGNNDAFDFGKGAFTNTPIRPSIVMAPGVGDGYFNFSTYYCADSGGPGVFDDLPYLRPAVQTDDASLAQDRRGSCEYTGTRCQADGDCENYYQSSLVSFAAPRSAAGVCGGTMSTAPAVRYYLDDNDAPLGCSSDAECAADQNYTGWRRRSGITAGASCLSLGALPKRPLSCYRYPPLKRFIFTNKGNNDADAIGIQVFSNPRHLTPEEWYAQDRRSGGQGFRGTVQSTKIDGYDAVSDGKNVYVDALNYSTSTRSLYDLIYLMSISDDARPETRQVFDALVKNFRLTTNLTANDGYCGAAMNVPDYNVPCRSDFDCPSGKVCAVQVEKLRRDYQRLRDLRAIDASLESYAADRSPAAAREKVYPDLKEGTYLAGQTLSVWSSWSVLGQAVGRALPLDPINQLGRAGTCTPAVTPLDTADIRCARGECQKPCTTNAECGAGEACTLHDAATGWSVADRRFSFACATSSFAYRYIYSTSTGYAVRSNIEDIGVPVDNLSGFLSGFKFSDPSRYNGLGFNGGGPGICNKDQEVVTINKGTCGDRQVNVANGEQCDPPGGQRFGSCIGGAVAVDVCNLSCQWVASTPPKVSCAYLSKCGNGRVEAGESCDDGALNGKYNHCSNTCTGKVAAYNPVYPSVSPGFCGDGQKNPTYEICDNATGQPLYATNPTDKTTSCSPDCQSYGTYCGDGAVQTVNDEECDPAASDFSCTDSLGNGGKFECNSDCTKNYVEGMNMPAGGRLFWWKFEDLPNGVVPDAFGPHPGACASGACPAVSSTGKFGRAYEFTSARAVGASFVGDTSSDFSFGFWIKPSALPPVNSGVWRGEIGGLEFTVEFDSSGSPLLRVMNGTTRVANLNANAIVQLHRWSKIVVTYDGNNLVLFVDSRRAATVALPVSAWPLMDSIDEWHVNVSIGYLNGLIDEAFFYNRAFTDSELNRLGVVWCVAAAATTPPSPEDPCGNGAVDTAEACDNGAQRNGVACTPSYGRACSYCAADCKNRIDIQPTQYCGDGVVQAAEVCDTDAVSTVYAKSLTIPATTQSNLSQEHNGFPVLACANEPSETNVFKKGTKICGNNCTAILTKETNQAGCVRCGIDEDRGVVVKGNILNVLEVASPATSQNPLYVRRLSGGGETAGRIILYGGSKKLAYVYQNVTSPLDKNKPSSAYMLRNFLQTVDALLATDSLCYAGDGGVNYRLEVNEGSDPFLFPIKARPEPWQYDFVLSPVISAAGLKNRSAGTIAGSNRPGDIRIVASWVGENNFVGGFAKPVAGSPIIESLSFSQPPTTGFDYFTKPYNNLAAGVWNIWYHGRGQTPGLLSEESFTVDTPAMPDNTYVFYVRTEDGSAIKDVGRTAKLRVDIYLPRTGAAPLNYDTFTQPDKSFQFVLADASSNNPGASYWEVLKIQKTPASVAERIENVTVSLDNGRIVTGAAQF